LVDIYCIVEVAPAGRELIITSYGSFLTCWRRGLKNDEVEEPGAGANTRGEDSRVGGFSASLRRSFDVAHG
jgi:hypothetical protein